MAHQVSKLPIKTEVAPPPPAHGRYSFEGLRREIDRMFEDFDSSFFRPSKRSLFDFAPFGRLEATRLPAVDIAEKDAAYEITAELPGLDERSVDVTVSNGGLMIKGEKQEEKEEKKRDYHLSERRYGSFQRYFAIPEGVDSDRIAATFKNGVLTVILPKTPQAQKQEKKITVKSA